MAGLIGDKSIFRLKLDWVEIVLDKHHKYLNQALTFGSRDYGAYLTEAQSEVDWLLSTGPQMHSSVAIPLFNAAALRWFSGSCLMVEAFVRKYGASSK